MHADAAFSIGKTHTVCQDYALAWNGPELSFAIVADGCSGSPDTDIGARLIARAAAKTFRWSHLGTLTDSGLAAEMSRYIYPWIKGLELKGSSVDATCLAVVASGGLVKAYVLGDGWIFAERRDGSLEVTRSSFVTDHPSNGFPVYPSLRWWGGFNRAAIMEANHLTRWDWLLESWVVRDGVWEPRSPVSWQITSALECGVVYQYDAADYRLIGALSDGADSFMRTVATTTSKQIMDTPFQEVAAKLLRFPEIEGPFATQRLKRFEKDCLKSGLFHSDDLAMAVVSFGDAS